MGGGTFGVDRRRAFLFQQVGARRQSQKPRCLQTVQGAPNTRRTSTFRRARANIVLDNLVDAGFMTEGQVFGARRNPATQSTAATSSPNYISTGRSTRCASWSIRFKILRRAAFRGPHRDRHERAARCGKAVENQLRQFGRDYHAPRLQRWLPISTAGVRHGRWPRLRRQPVQPRVDAYRQPGSSFKPYVYTTALMNGFKPTSTVVDGPVCLGNWCPQNYGHSYSGTVTLTQAITRSINVVPVKLSIAIGNNRKPVEAAKRGRAKIVQVARRFGIRRHCRIRRRCRSAPTKSPCSARRGLCDLPNKGKSVTPHAVLEVRTGTGDLVWRFDRDGKKPLQAIPASVAADMAGMMSPRRQRRYRATCRARRHSDRRQDRHHQRLPRCLVRRIYRQLRLRRLVRAMTITRRPTA